MGKAVKVLVVNHFIRIILCFLVVVFVDDTFVKVGALMSTIPLYLSIKMVFDNDTIFIAAIVKIIIALRITDHYEEFIILIFTLILTITILASIKSFLIGYTLVGILLLVNSFSIFILTRGFAKET